MRSLRLELRSLRGVRSLRSLRSLRSAAEEREIQLVFPHQGTVYADADLLRRAVANLVANAIRYADVGSTIAITHQSEPELLCQIMIVVERRDARF